MNLDVACKCVNPFYVISTYLFCQLRLTTSMMTMSPYRLPTCHAPTRQWHLVHVHPNVPFHVKLQRGLYRSQLSSLSQILVQPKFLLWKAPPSSITTNNVPLKSFSRGQSDHHVHTYMQHCDKWPPNNSHRPHYSGPVDPVSVWNMHPH